MSDANRGVAPDSTRAASSRGMLNTSTADLDRRFRRALLSLAVVAVLPVALPHSAEAQDSRAPTTGVALPDRSVSATSDATSLEVNPAGLGFIESAELRYGFELQFPGEQTGLQDEHAAYAAAGTEWFGSGISLQWLDRSTRRSLGPAYQKLTLGSAIRPVDGFSAGVGLNIFGSLQRRNINQLTSVDLGFQWRPSRYFGFGFAAKDTNRPFFDADRGLPVRFQPGAVLRLFRGGLVVGSQLEWTPARGTLLATPRASLEPLPGVRLFGRAAIPSNRRSRAREGLGWRVTAGMDVSLGRVGLEAATSARTRDATSGAFDSHAQHIWFSPTPRRSIVPTVGQWVEFDLSGRIAERGTGSLFRSPSQQFLNILTDLRDIGDDPRVDGVLLRIGNTNLGYGQVWELRRQLDELRNSGTASIAFLEQPGFLEAYLASGADRVFMLPNELYEPEGVRVTTNNYGEALRSVGVEAEFVRIGEYKSAPEGFVRDEPSEPALEQLDQLVDDLHGEIAGSIADGRGLERGEVQEGIDSIPLYPGESVQRGFVDDILYEDELRPHIRREYGALEFVEGGYDPTPGPDQGWDGGRPEVAVVHIDGSIIRGESTETPLFGDVVTGSKTIVDTLERLGDNPLVRAVVLRIDSPGGSAVASDLIYRAIRRVAQVKPVIASMGNVAASGGYYVAAGADTIFATPNTITGSVGIFAGKFNVEKLADWVGVTHTVVDRGERSGQFDPYSAWSDEQRKGVAESIEYLYQLFLEQAAQTRPLDVDELDERARGRVWSGRAARDEELVDHVGGLLEAIRRAEKEAGLYPGSARYRSYPLPTSFLDVPGASAEALRSLVDELTPSSSDEGRIRNTAVRAFLERLERSVRLPLLYDQGEPLMLPPTAITVGPE